MVRVVLAVALAAVVQFAWGFVFHGPLSALSHMTSHATDQAALDQALASALPESGTYMAPMCPGMNASEEAKEAFKKRAAAGPSVQIHYRKEGFSPEEDMPALMGMGFGHTVLTALLAAGLLWMAVPGLTTYRSRVLFVAGLGVFAMVATRLGDAIWFPHHWAFVLGQVVFGVSAWVLAGVVMGAIIRPDAASQRAHGARPQQQYPFAA